MPPACSLTLLALSPCLPRCLPYPTTRAPAPLPRLPPCSNVVIELLRETEQLKRSDIMEAAKQRGIPVSDTLYSKVVKELCSSRGSIWSLK